MVLCAGGESRGTGLGLVSSCDVSAGVKSSFATGSRLVRRGGGCETGTWVVFETRLFNAGQPLHPSAPPVPLQCPPPGHEPVGIWFAETYVALPLGPCSVADGDRLCLSSGTSLLGLTADTGIGAGLFKLVGRDVLRAFKYNPQALQIVDPMGERRQSGVWFVPQLLYFPIRVSMLRRELEVVAALQRGPSQVLPADLAQGWWRGDGRIMHI